MISVEGISMIALFVAIGGQYALLFQIYRTMGEFQLEFAACPYHRMGRRPPGVLNEE